MGCKLCKNDDALDDSSSNANRPEKTTTGATKKEEEDQYYQAPHLVEEKTVNDTDSSSNDHQQPPLEEEEVIEEQSPIVGSERYSSLRDEVVISPGDDNAPLLPPPAAAAAATTEQQQQQPAEAAAGATSEEKNDEAVVVMADAPMPGAIKHTDSMLSSATSVDTSFDQSEMDDDDDEDDIVQEQQPLRRVETQSQMHQELLSKLEAGSLMTKHSSGRTKPQQRIVFVLGDRLFWNEPTKKVAKKSKSILIAEIQEIQRGKMAKRFQRGPSASKELYPGDQCMTIVSKKKSLHLSTESQAERDLWVEGLQYARKKLAIMMAFAASDEQL